MQRLLVIDDDLDIRDVLADVLSAEGYQVEKAIHGADALSKLESDPLPELILLDLMMPVMSGWEFRTRQLGSERLASIPVILLSANAQAETAASVLEVQGLLHKPLSLEVLLDAIAKHLH